MEKTNILIVEDDWIVAEDLRSILKNKGYSVTGVVHSGEDAVKKALKERPDLILMDIMLKGGMSGTDAATQIKEQVDIPIIFITAYIRNKVSSKYDSVQNCAYVTKPFKEHELVDAIETALSRCPAG